MRSKFTGKPPPAEAFDLGLAISGATMLPGQRRTFHEIKCYIDAAIEVMTGTHRTISCSRIQQIEEKGLRKLRHPQQIRKLR